MRRYIVEAPLYWLQEFNLDGLRFDAIDQLIDGVKAQAIQIKLLQPVERRFHDIAAHRINVIGRACAGNR